MLRYQRRQWTTKVGLGQQSCAYERPLETKAISFVDCFRDSGLVTIPALSIYSPLCEHFYPRWSTEGLLT